MSSTKGDWARGFWRGICLLVGGGITSHAEAAGLLKLQPVVEGASSIRMELPVGQGAELRSVQVTVFDCKDYLEQRAGRIEWADPELSEWLRGLVEKQVYASGTPQLSEEGTLLFDFAVSHPMDSRESGFW